MWVDRATQVQVLGVFHLLKAHLLQVLSESVSHALHLTGGDEALETAHFVGFMISFLMSSMCTTLVVVQSVETLPDALYVTN